MSDEGKDDGGPEAPDPAVADAEGDAVMTEAAAAAAAADGPDEEETPPAAAGEEGAEVVEADVNAEKEKSGDGDAAEGEQKEEEAPSVAAAAPAAAAPTDPPSGAAPAETAAAAAEDGKSPEEPPEDSRGGAAGGESEAERAARARSEDLGRALALSDAESTNALLRSERDGLRSEVGRREAEAAELRSEIASLRAEAARRDEEAARAKAEASRERAAKEAAAEEGREAKERAERAGLEMDALREEISQLTASKSSLNAELSELRTNASLSTSSAVPLQYELERIRTELDSVKSHSGWLESELDARTSELAKARASHSESSSTLRSERDDAVARAEEAAAALDAGRRSEERLRSELDRTGARLRDVRSEAADREAALEEELVAERRLVELSKEKADRAEARREALRAEMVAMKKVADAAAADSREELESLGREMEEKTGEALEALAAEKDRTIADLERRAEEAERGRRKIEEDLMKTPTPLKRRRRRAPLAIAAGDGAEPRGQDGAEGEPMSLTDLYARLSETEDELGAERTENKRLQLMLRRIQIDIEEKTPLMRQQAREAEAAIRAGDELRARMQEALAEAEAERSRSRAAEVERAERDGECRALRSENADLATQVQALLRRVAGASAEGAVGAGDGDVVEFGSVTELQSQNQRLLREHRRLQDQVAGLESKLETEPLRIRVEEAEAELVQLREERERQVTLVKGIVQQRDLYRALLSKSDNRALASAEGGGDGVLAIEGGMDPSAEAKNRDLENELAKVRSDLVSVTNAKKALEERVARLDAHAADLTSSVDDLRTDVSVAHAAKARSDADATYHRERVARLEESLDSTRNEVARAAKARKELQRVNEELQKSLEIARADESHREQQLRQVETKLRLCEAQVQTAQSAESRVSAEAASLRNELARQGALLDSVQRIEASLSAKTTEDRARLEEELKSKTDALKSERVRHGAEVEELKGQVADAALKALEAEKAKASAMNDMVKAKEDAVRAKEDHRAISERCSVLEKALAEAKLRMGEAGVGEVDEEQIASTATKLEEATADLATANERIEDLKNIAAASEKEVSNLTKAQEEYQKAKDAEIKELQDKLASLRQLAQSKQDMLEELGKELATHRGEQEKAVSDLKSRVAELETEKKNAVEDAAAARAQVESLSQEIKSYQADASAANDNYERELALHAAARTELRNARSQKEEEARLLRTLESQLESYKLEVVGEKEAWEASKLRFEQSLTDAETRLKEAKEQNKVLHSQMATLTESVDKLQSKRISSLAGNGEGEGGAPSSEVVSAEEGAALRKTVSELREVVKYMRSEREVQDAQLESAKRTAERERAAASAARRSLDSARNELQTLQDGNKGLGDKENEMSAEEKDAAAGKLRRAEEQLTLLRESNSLLRDEAVKTERSLEATRKELDELKKLSEPAEDRCRALEVDKAALEAEKTSLVREVDAWKGRVQSLVSKFNQIDPEEHVQALARVDAAKKECNYLKNLKDKAEKETIATKALLVRLNKEITVHKMHLDSAKNSLAKVSSEKASLQKAAATVGPLTEERNQLQEAKEKAETDVKTAKMDLAGATKRVENFQKMLRKMKTQNEELKKENYIATSKQKELQEALAKHEEAVKQQQAPSQKKPDSAPMPSPGASTAKENSVLSEAQKDKPQEKNAETPAPKQQVLPAALDAQDIPKIPDGGFKFAPSSTVGKDSAPIATGAQQPSTSALEASVSTNGDQGKKHGTASTKRTESGAEPIAKKARLPVPDAAATRISSPAKIVAPSPTVTTPSKLSSPKLKPGSPKPAQGTNEDSLREKLLKRKRLLAAKLKKKEEEEVSKESESAPPAKRPALGKQELAGEKKVLKPTETKEEESKAVTAEKLPGSLMATEKKEAKPEGKSDKGKVPTPQEKSSLGASVASPKASSGLAFGSGTNVGFPSSSAVSGFAGGSIFGAGLGFGGASSLAKTEEGAAGASASTPLGQGLGFGGSSQLGNMAEDGAASLMFGAQTTDGGSIGGTAFGDKPADGVKRTSSTFLDLVPPGSGGDKPALVFGKSSSITLPTPKGKIATPVAPSYGIFGQSAVTTGASPSSPFGAPVGFGADTSKKRPIDSGGGVNVAQTVSQVETSGALKAKEGKLNSASGEEGEIEG